MGRASGETHRSPSRPMMGFATLYPSCVAIDVVTTVASGTADDGFRCALPILRWRCYSNASSSAALKRSGRSEEHTSVLQSLMRISYAVFCLTKKTEARRQHL